MEASVPSGRPSPLEKFLSELSPAVPESVVILRVAQGMVLPLCAASDVGEQVRHVRVHTRGVTLETISVPFRVARIVMDPATKLKISVGLSIESGRDSETVRLGLECDPIPIDQTWKVSL